MAKALLDRGKLNIHLNMMSLNSPLDSDFSLVGFMTLVGICPSLPTKEYALSNVLVMQGEMV